ncbi:hypothetical protein IAR50_002797 [Cryptococcus sp. DSM 104548]
MNTLSRLDAWLSAPFTPTPSSRAFSKQASSSSSRSASPSLSSASTSRSASSSPAQTHMSTPLGRPPTPTQPRSRRTPKRRRRRQTYSSLQVPPPTTPLIIRIALVLWSILLSFWRSFVGETRATRGRGRRRVRGRGSAGLGGAVSVSAGLEGLRELGERVLVNAGISPPEDEQDHDGEGSEGEGWVDPVTRGPEGAESMEEVPPGEDEFAATVSGGELRLDPGTADDETIRANGPDPNFTFRLRSAARKSSEDEVASGRTTPSRKPIPFERPPSPTSILENPIPYNPNSKLQITLPDEQPVQPAPRRASGGKLLANPISTSLLDPSVPAPASNAESTLFRKPSPRLPKAVPTTPFHLQKTLILDLDETLIHSTSRPLSYPGGSSGGGGILGLSLGGVLGIGGKGKGREGHTVEVVVNGRSTMYHVYKRPYVDHFLRKVAAWYTLVIYTASMPEYADPVIDWLDGGRNLFARKLYRESCYQQPNGSYIKDLALVEKDLSRVCFMDNSPISYSWNKANALPIEGWTSDPNDEALLHSIPVLDSLRFVNDVRRVLGIRGFT